MSDDGSFNGGSDSDNESEFSNDELNEPSPIRVNISNLIKTAENDSDKEESDLESDDENAKGADEREDIDFIPIDDEGDDDTNYNKNIIIGDNSTNAKSLLQIDDDDDDDDEDNETYLQKFNTEVNKNYIADFHPECIINNYEEITTLTKIIKDSEGSIIDDLHRTIPFLTKYEKARILGQRTKQINTGAKVFVKVPEGIIDGYIIANLELEQKRLPFIIRRPIAGGGCEYWNLKDLENIAF